jgi:DMSO/TMAO reductase YedYZ heme-binding membrane subunit
MRFTAVNPLAGYRSAMCVMLAGCVSFSATYAWILRLQAEGRSAAALDMPDMGMTDVDKYWAFPVLQASGLIGLLFAYVSILIGLAQSSRFGRRFPVRRLHRQLSLLVVGLVLVHVAATALDAMGNTWVTVLIPGHVAETGWPEAEWGFDTGIFALYVLLFVAPTFYLRRFIGAGNWRALHRFVLIFYILAFWHAFILGLELSHYQWVRPVIWLAQVPLAVLLLARLRGAGAIGRGSMIALSAVVIVAVCVLVATGNSGFIQTI